MLSKRYIKIGGGKNNGYREENNIQIAMDYELGGHSVWTGQFSRRGYYLYCTPVTLSDHDDGNGRTYTTISQTLFRGKKLLLKEVSRRSKKAEKEAEEIAKKELRNLVYEVCRIYGYTLLEEIE